MLRYTKWVDWSLTITISVFIVSLMQEYSVHNKLQCILLTGEDPSEKLVGLLTVTCQSSFSHLNLHHKPQHGIELVHGNS